MSRTTILPTDPNKRKAWAASVANDAAQKQYFARLIGPEGSRSAVIKKTELEKGAGDEVTTALVAKLHAKPFVKAASSPVTNSSCNTLRTRCASMNTVMV